MRPITPQPGYTDADLTALLATRQFAYADCYTFTNKDGVVLRYASSQKKVNIQNPVPDAMSGPLEYQSNLVKVSGLKLQLGVGVEVDEQDIVLEYSENLLYNGQMSFGAALRYGRFDGSVIRRDRYFATSWGQPWVGGVPMFVGLTSTLESVSRSECAMKVKSSLVLLKTPMPRKSFQPGCLWTLFDGGCGLDRNDFDTAGTIGVGSTASVINWAGAVAGMRFGTVYVEDGSGVTQVRTIEDVNPGVSLTLAYPLDFTPVGGETFVSYPGCIRTYARCGELGNQSRYRGYPYVPVPETSY